jgi:hypothetical protein
MTQPRLNLKKIQFKRVDGEKVGNEYDYSFEFYYDWVLSCPGKENVIVAKDLRFDDRPKLEEKHFSELLGIPFDAKLRRQLFLRNRALFESISFMDPELKLKAMGKEYGLEQIAEAKFLLDYRLAEYNRLRKKFLKGAPKVYLQGDA